MNKLPSRLTAVFLCLFLLLPTAVSAAGLDQFTKKNTFQAELFTDLSSSAWYYDSVRTCYELGLMSGYNDQTFRPGGRITLAECIVIAARVHNIYRSGLGIFDQTGVPWYDIPVKYAISSKIIAADDFPDYTLYATRAQMAYIFASAMPASDLAAINTVTAIPDVSADSPYSGAIYQLYRAGVLTGRGDERYFDPDVLITRGEASTIISRIIVPAYRQSFTLAPDTAADPAAPSEPAAPAEPSEPSEPAAPVEPITPAAPVEPADPAAPEEPSAGDADPISGTPLLFADVQSFSEGFAAVSQNGSWGYIGTDGRMLTGTVYAAAYPFHEGKGVVLTALPAGGYAVGYVDRTGDYTALGVNVGPGLAYTGVGGRFSGGYLLLKGNVGALIDPNGAFFPLGALTSVESEPRDGLILLDFNPAGEYPDYRYADLNGSIVLDLTCVSELSSLVGDAILDAGPFENGMAPVIVGSFAGGRMVSSVQGFIDLTGRVVYTGLGGLNEQSSSAFAGGVATGLLADGATPAIITSAGSAIPLAGCASVLAPSADSPLIGMRQGGRYGFVGKTGATVVAPQFESALPYSGGLAAVRSGGRYGFIDESGDWAFSPLYEEVRSFDGGFGWGRIGTVWYILEY